MQLQGIYPKISILPQDIIELIGKRTGGALNKFFKLGIIERTGQLPELILYSNIEFADQELFSDRGTEGCYATPSCPSE